MPPSPAKAPSGARRVRTCPTTGQTLPTEAEILATVWIDAVAARKTPWEATPLETPVVRRLVARRAAGDVRVARRPLPRDIVVEGVVRAPHQPSPKHAWNGYDAYRFTGEQGAVALAVLFGAYATAAHGLAGYGARALFALWLWQVPIRIAADVLNRRYAASGRRVFGPICL